MLTPASSISVHLVPLFKEALEKHPEDEGHVTLHTCRSVHGSYLICFVARGLAQRREMTELTLSVYLGVLCPAPALRTVTSVAHVPNHPLSHLQQWEFVFLCVSGLP